MLFSLHVNSSFSCLFLWLISSFMPSWSEKMLEIIYILLNLLALTLCTSVWSVLEKGNAHLKRMCITGLPLLLCCFACSVQSLSHVWLFVTPWTAVCQASLSITSSRSSPKHMSIESVMPSNHLILCCPLLFLPSNLSQHQGLFKWVLSSSHQVARLLEFQLQHQSFQWIPRTDLF